MTHIEYPDIPLYHYTSLGALLGIIENKTIRLTDYRFLNDTSELIFAIDELRKSLDLFSQNPYCSYIVEVLENIKKEEVLYLPITVGEHGENIIIPEMRNVHYYVLSLSQKADQLPMWKMYAKNGCCIKFNRQKINAFFDDFRDRYMGKGIFNTIKGDVLYGSNDLYDKIFLETVFKNPNSLSIYDIILNYCLKRKTDAFSYESEYRLGIHFGDHLLELDGKTDVEKVFFQSSDIIKPQIELKNFPVTDIIEEIIVSPYNSELAVLGIQELLAKHSISKDIVKKSDITIR